MNDAPLNRTRHSADVRMHLRLNGRDLPIAQLGPDFLILRQAVAHPPANAEIFMSIDGNERHWPVHLRDGLSPADSRARIGRPLSEANGTAAE